MVVARDIVLKGATLITRTYIQIDTQIVLYTEFRKKNTHSHFLSYLHELFVDFNKNCSEYTHGLIDSDNVKIRYSLRSMT